MDPLEGSQRPQWRARHFWEFQIELSHFIAGPLACIRYRGFSNDRAARRHRAGGSGKSAIREGGVTQAIPKGIEGGSLKVAISAAFHRVILERRQLAHILVERNRQPARWIVAA